MKSEVEIGVLLDRFLPTRVYCAERTNPVFIRYRSRQKSNWPDVLAANLNSFPDSTKIKLSPRPSPPVSEPGPQAFGCRCRFSIAKILREQHPLQACPHLIQAAHTIPSPRRTRLGGSARSRSLFDQRSFRMRAVDSCAYMW